MLGRMLKSRRHGDALVLQKDWPVTTFLVVGGIALLVCGYLAFDWWLAGHKSKRTLTRSRDGQVGNSRVDEHVIERLAQNNRDQTSGF